MIIRNQFRVDGEESEDVLFLFSKEELLFFISLNLHLVLFYSSCGLNASSPLYLLL